ncbi:ANTAR domain-containing protein [Plantibacter sp. YIM 135347]|uniref:ANTAR domain-containing protein n=1 Tax=Plantibacter sp. YIM 135347 TaxID=3423919 RepID=UPI003D33AA1E
MNTFSAFPLAVGALDVGAVTLYTRSSRQLTEAELGTAETLAGLAALQVLRHAMRHRDDIDDDALFSRREVHQATGMVISQLSVSATDALLLLRARAFASDQPVRAVAADVLARRITFVQ